MRTATFLAIPLVLAAASCNLGEAREGSFQRTLQVSGKTVIEIQSGAGNINVRAGDAQSVSVTGRIRARSSWPGMSGEAKVQRLRDNPPIEQQGNTIYIGRINEHELRRNVTISYDITVPPDTQITSTTGAGNQRIRGITRPVNARTGAGNITLEDVYGDAQLHTGAGNIDVRGPQGSLLAESGAGTVTADGSPKRNWQVTVGAGSIHVHVPMSASFDLNAQSGFGSVSIDRDLKLQGSISNSHVSGTVGNGGPTVQLSSGAGSIRVD